MKAWTRARSPGAGSRPPGCFSRGMITFLLPKWPLVVRIARAMLARRWRTSGPFRLLILLVAVAAGVALLALSGGDSQPTPSKRAAAERAKLTALRTEQARIRAAERR